MQFWKSLSGLVKVELISALPAAMLTAINAQGIEMTDVTYVSELTVCCTVRRRDYHKLCRVLNRRGETVRILGKKGIYWTVATLKKRPVLLFGTAFILLLALLLPTRILFVEVEGNTNVPDALILEKANFCGISFWASRREVRSESVKNALLAEIPQLQWAGVNTSGCTAIISVRERTQPDDVLMREGINSIVAAKDGIIESCTVTQGSALCKIGQAVKAGQVLVSGYTDCGLYIRATGAEAEIFAQTAYQIRAIAPSITQTRVEAMDSNAKYSLILGKKLINLSQGSGISDGTCVKMYKRYYITLPGGYQLPIGLLCERYILCEFRETAEAEQSSLRWIETYTEDYLESQMISGKILDADYILEQGPDFFVLSGHCFCSEMIGRLHSEEIVERNGENY